jgi:3-oxoacyl-[acyl-carrier-protein] synthase-3
LIRSEIISTGRYVPPRVVTNAELEGLMETTDEWIRQRTGIEERHWVEGGVNTSDLGLQAAKQALDKASLKPQDLDCIIFATLSADHFFPGSGCFLQAKLGLDGIPALDVRNQCSGFLYGLSIADAWIRTGQYKRILLVGAEVQSPALDRSTRGRDMAVLFGDGAGAVILGPCEDGRGVLSTHLHADGRHGSVLWLEVPASSMDPHITEAALAEGRHHPRMDGSKVFKHAITKMPAVVREALEQNGASLDQIKCLIPHQANLRIAEAVQKGLGLRDDQVFNNIQRYGNTTAASIPIALDEAVEQGRIGRGDLVALCAFGAGFTWASALLRY